jgi:large subunit ribosomal protein L14
MIQPRSIVQIADNSGAKIGRIFKILGSSKKRYARLGEMVVLSIQKAEPRKNTKKKDVVYVSVCGTKDRDPSSRDSPWQYLQKEISWG